MSPRKRFVIFLTAVVGFILILFLIFGKGSSNTPKKTDTKKTNNTPSSLVDYIDRDSKVILTVSGRINGDDVHRQIRITVSPTDRVAEVIQGYQNNVIKTQNITNNRQAYDQFMRALARTGFSKERKSSLKDERGICPTGQRYVYEIIDNNDQVSRTWAGQCNAGNSLGNAPLILQLFRNQITDYGKFVNGVNL
ncbi:MAG: hypothetical protein NTX11_01375 [Candidatus Saccharibacteria bacterium]|nr:hypothetical protein [Candidatus Saccharibacteria bacterium]